MFLVTVKETYTMKAYKQYIEAGILTFLYFFIVHLVVNAFGMPKIGVLKIISYPYKLFSTPLETGRFTIEVLNRTVFVIYFTWAFCCVYLSAIKGMVRQLSFKKLTK